MKLKQTVTNDRLQVTRGPRLDCAPDVAQRLVIRQTQNSSLSAFTLVEIALCLAIIGFALVAIVGVLPFGLNVQQKNREETIINQDAQVWMNTLRHGAQGFDDLTNYVIAITNTYRLYNMNNGRVTPVGPLHVAAYTRTHSTLDGSPIPFVLTNGFNIIGLLSTPKYQPMGGIQFQSNTIVANVRALSGDAVEKFPQTNPDVLDQGFSYRMAVEIVPYVPFDPRDTMLQFPFKFPALYSTNAATRVMNTLLSNCHDIRLLFRWPLLPNGRAGGGRQSFRALTGGYLYPTNSGRQFLYFLESSKYAQDQ